jgi:hypothetical protein
LRVCQYRALLVQAFLLPIVIEATQGV